MGEIYVLGIGPGSTGKMTLEVRAALEKCTVIAGFDCYIELIGDIIYGKRVISSGMTKEAERCRAAIDCALEGETVALVSGGDAGVYGMAGLLLELCEPWPELNVVVMPGVTAACSAAAVLGAPLTHDFAVISLSDLLTPWEIIERRLKGAAEAGFVICIYNPASNRRKGYLQRACKILLDSIHGQTLCGTVRNTGREGERSWVGTLDELSKREADMFTTVVIGNSTTRLVNGRLVTPRGYEL